jgi:hypothetical protein
MEPHLLDWKRYYGWPGILPNQFFRIIDIDFDIKIG